MSETHTTLLPPILSPLSEEQWRILAVLCCETRLTVSAIDRLSISTATRRWLLDSIGQGLLLDAGIAYGMPFTRSLAGERALAAVPEVRSHVLRRIANMHALSATRADAHAVAGERTFAGFVTAIFSGDLSELVSETSNVMRSSARGEEATLIRSRLLEAVCVPFDAGFLASVWGDSASVLVEQVLADARVALDPVGELHRWALSRASGTMSKRLRCHIADHALLRDDIDTLDQLIANPPAADQLPLRIARAVLKGELAQAQDLLSELVGGKNPPQLAISWPTGITVLLLLLALRRDLQAALPLAKRLLQRLGTTEPPAIAGWPVAALHLPVARAVRSLMRRMTQPDSERIRLSPHHHPIDSPAWETIVLALTVQLEECDALTKLGWTRRLFTDAKRWHEAGYTWMARQALEIGRALSPNEPIPSDSPTDYRSDELLLTNSLEREPEWRRALRALERFAETAERGESMIARRVAWFLDMASGELAKPAIEEYRSGEGWKRGHRVDFEELRSVRDTLPPEDVAVIRAIDSVPKKVHLPADALEALCGHPRVFNGARGRQQVDVIRGHCRIETREDRGHLVIHVVPAGAIEGVNVVVEGETRVVVYRVDAALAKLMQLLPTGIRIPESQSKEGLAVLAMLANHVEIQSPQLGALRMVTADANPCIRISPDAGAFWVEVGVRPFGEFGRFFPPGLGRALIAVHSDEELFDTERNLADELARYHALIARCPTLECALKREMEETDNALEPCFSASFGEEELYTLLIELRDVTPACALEWKNCRSTSPRGKVSSASLHGSLRRVKGWYLVNGRINLDTISPIDLADLVRMPFTKSGRFIRLPNGDFVEVERRIQQVLSNLRSVAQLPARGANNELRVPDAAFVAMHELVEAETSMAVDPATTEWLSHLNSLLAAEPSLPIEVNATLRPYQLEGFHWLWRHSQIGHGVCLADDMGLGKTLQVIALLITRASGGPTLVVTPTSVCSNWLDELGRFAPTLSAIEYVGKSRTALLQKFTPAQIEPKPDVLIVSYAMLQQDIAALAAIEWNTAVLDEAQFIKNPHSLRAKAAFSISARHRVAMTGTPIENHLGDLWSIFHFLNPNLLGSYKHFQLSYLKPVDRDLESGQQTLLKKLIQPFLLRRRKNDVLQDLPAVTTLCHEVRLSEDETLRYALLRRQIHEKLYTSYGKRDHKLQVLAEITRLRRFCCHPRLVFPDASMESSKMQVFLELAEELRENGHRALVFSQFVDFLALVREQLDERGIGYQYLDGSTPKQARHARVQAFQSGNSELFLISLKAGGFGLNLTGADYVIHLDPWWNPAVEAQATDRAHRIGQVRPVTVYRLVTKDSIEERIVELHREKRAISDAILDESGQSSTISGEELLDLLQLE